MMGEDMRITFDGLSGRGVFLACAGLASAFVLSLYAVSSGQPRNHPVTVRRRMAVILFVSLLSPVYVWLWSAPASAGAGQQLWEALGLRWAGFAKAAGCAGLLVAAAYLGPLVHLLSEGENPLEGLTQDRSDICLRNYVVAPLCEEFVFRGCMLPLLLPLLGPLWAVLLCPLFFSLAHLHHFLEWLWNGQSSLAEALATLLAQVCYTSLFGAFSAFLFVRTGHLVSAILAHSLCNLLGLPPVDRLATHPHRLAMLALYVLGLCSFLLLLFPLTEPSWFL